MKAFRSLLAGLAALPLAVGLALAERSLPDPGSAWVLLGLPGALLVAVLAAPPRDGRDAAGLALGLGTAAALSLTLLVGPGLLLVALGADALEWGAAAVQVTVGALLALVLAGSLQAGRRAKVRPEASGAPRGERNLPPEPG